MPPADDSRRPSPRQQTGRTIVALLTLGRADANSTRHIARLDASECRAVVALGAGGNSIRPRPIHAKGRRRPGMRQARPPSPFAVTDLGQEPSRLCRTWSSPVQNSSPAQFAGVRLALALSLAKAFRTAFSSLENCDDGGRRSDATPGDPPAVVISHESGEDAFIVAPPRFGLRAIYASVAGDQSSPSEGATAVRFDLSQRAKDGAGARALLLQN